MKRSLILVGLLIPIAGLTAFAVRLRTTSSHAPSPVAVPAALDVIAAPGRVEPISEEVRVGAEMSGKLRDVPVEEGDRVEAGQVVAILENDDYRARVALAEAQLALKEAELRRVINGARQQERREALASVKETEAVMENARVEQQRRQTGFMQGVFAKEEADRAEREFGVARARYEAAVQRHALVDDEAREEDRSRAEADVMLARARLAEVCALLEKTIVRAPLRGIVLRKHLKKGETFSDQRNIPILTLGDDSVLRVRMDVDETDVSRVRIGQRAYVTADTFRGEKFWGRVVRIGELLGRKNILTDRPTERVDTKVLETLIELEDGRKLRPGLRVDAFIVLNDEAAPSPNR
ncbi:MAG: HlyD family efflux transporter periplasmic adaptor subunit [Acidobacteria bacterium]|nr:HlyD family efflux transporter periplasmic adaptor subunit [Acidobacteriota bacterium]